MTDRPHLTFFFPAYNEEANVERTVERALADIGPLVPSLEVVIVDDGSTDRTPELADALATAHPEVRVVHQANRGYGGALQAGFAAASGSLISFSDGDLQFDLKEMERLLTRLEDPAPASERSCARSATSGSCAWRSGSAAAKSSARSGAAPPDRFGGRQARARALSAPVRGARTFTTPGSWTTNAHDTPLVEHE